MISSFTRASFGSGLRLNNILSASCNMYVQLNNKIALVLDYDKLKLLFWLSSFNVFWVVAR